MCVVGSRSACRSLLVAVAVLAGCAAVGPPAADTVAAARSALAAAPLCCSTLADAPRAALPLPDSPVPIGSDRPVFEFDGRRAFFVLYELPVFTTPYALLVESQPVEMASTFGKGGGLFGVSAATAKTLLTPGVLTLDAGFKPLRRFDVGTLRPRGDGFEQTVFVNASNAAERYLVIYGVDRDDVVTRTYSSVTSMPVMAGGVMFTMVGGEDRQGKVHFSPTGSLRIKVTGLAPAGTR